MIGKIDARRYGEAAVEVRRRVSSSSNTQLNSKRCEEVQLVRTAGMVWAFFCCLFAGDSIRSRYRTFGKIADQKRYTSQSKFEESTKQ